MKSYIAYYRVSTSRQGKSGLGLAAQRAAVEQHAQQHGGGVVAEFTETESGRKSDRPALLMALAKAKRQKATLLVAKLDRLSRNVAFIATLLDSRADLECCDFPEANRLTLHILAAVAEHEARMISDRTKAALAAAKGRGQLLGSARPGHLEAHGGAVMRGLRKAQKASARLRNSRNEAFYVDVRPRLQAWQAEGKSLVWMAERLNSEDKSTIGGGKYHPATISRLLI